MNWDLPKQTIENAPGQTGDCWRCCIAAILQRPAVELPHFVAEARQRKTNPDADTQRWLNAKGYWLVEADRSFRYPGWMREIEPPPVISCGPTVRSKRPEECHAVVATIEGKLLYDPHPSNAGLLAVVDQYLIVPIYRSPVGTTG